TDRLCDRRELSGDALETTRGQGDCGAVLDTLRAIAVPLHLIGPRLALRERARRHRHHGRDRSGWHDRQTEDGRNAPALPACPALPALPALSIQRLFSMAITASSCCRSCSRRERSRVTVPF